MTLASATSLVQRLVSVPGYSGDEKATADAVAVAMEEFGYSEIHVDDLGSVIGIVGPSDAEIALLFDGHIDVATVSGDWSFPPYCGEIRDGKLLGRGSTDMKGGLGAAIFAVAQAAREKKLTKRVAVSASVMEETIEGLALNNILTTYKPANVVICEPSELAVMVGQKGRLEILLTLLGKSSHASNPEIAINPISLAAHALLALEQLAPPVDPQLGEGILVPTDIITTPYPSISIIPEQATIRLDRRTLPGESFESIFAEMEAHLHASGIEAFHLSVSEGEFEMYTGKKVTKAVDLPSWKIEEDSWLAQAMKKAVLTAGGEYVTNTWNCCTNGSESFGNHKIPTIGLGPGSILQAHVVDEFISVEQIERAAEIYKNLVLSI